MKARLAIFLAGVSTALLGMGAAAAGLLRRRPW